MPQLSGRSGTVPRSDEPQAEVPRPDLRTLFVAFLLVGLSGFGGVLPFARHMLVDGRRWLSPQEFTETLAMSQILPGPNIVNITVAVGMRFRGAAGAAVSLLGLMAMPVAIAIALGAIYDRYGDLPVVERIFNGVASAAAGLIVAVAIRIVWPYVGTPRVVALASAVFVAIVVLKVPLVIVIVAAAPISVAWTWIAGRG